MYNSHEIRILNVHYGAKNIQITNIGFLEMTIWYLLVVGLSHKISENSLIDQ
jgi:hypothetical protein